MASIFEAFGKGNTPVRVERVCKKVFGVEA